MSRRRNTFTAVAASTLGVMLFGFAPSAALAADEVEPVAAPVEETSLIVEDAAQGEVPAEEAPVEEVVVEVPALIEEPAVEAPQTPAVTPEAAVEDVPAAAVEESAEDTNAGVAVPTAIDPVEPSGPPPAQAPAPATAAAIAAADTFNVVSVDVAQQLAVTFQANVPESNAWLYGYLTLPNGSSYDLSWGRVLANGTSAWYFGSDLPNGAYPFTIQDPSGERTWVSTAIIWNGVGPNPGTPTEPSTPEQPQEPTPGTPEQPAQPGTPGGVEAGNPAAPVAGNTNSGIPSVTDAGPVQNVNLAPQQNQAAGATSAAPETLVRTGVETNIATLLAIALTLAAAGGVLLFRRRFQ